MKTKDEEIIIKKKVDSGDGIDVKTKFNDLIKKNDVIVKKLEFKSFIDFDSQV